MSHARRARSCWSAAIALVVLAVGGCGGDGEAADPGGSTADFLAEAESTAAALETDPRARKALKAAVLDLLRANTGRYELDIPFGGGVSIREVGRYQISPLAFETVREQISPEGTVRVTSRGVGDQVWLRMENLDPDGAVGQGWPCWVDYAAIAGMSAFPAELTQGPAGQPPAAVVSASWGTGRQRTGEGAMQGTTDLASALGLVSGKLLVAAGVDPQGDAVVPATFTLDGATLSGVDVLLADLPAAIEAAGGSPIPEIGDLAALPGSISTRFDSVGGPVDVSAPPVGERLDAVGDDFETAMESCGTAGAPAG